MHCATPVPRAGRFGRRLRKATEEISHSSQPRSGCDIVSKVDHDFRPQIIAASAALAIPRP